jgi:hypothetical protein
VDVKSVQKRTIELIYDSECPNAEATRERLRQALAAASLPPRWKEWNRADPACPEYARRFGSPTVLIDRRDIVGLGPDNDGSACRLYAGPEGRSSGAPTVASIVAALLR